MIVQRISLLALATLSLAGLVAHAQQTAAQQVEDRAERHQTAEWLIVEPHLPDLKTGEPAKLQMAGDVLRARRMPEDAIEYYRAAYQRGGDEATELNRIGVTLLELHDTAQARTCFKRAVLLKRKSSEAWNNLGAAEYIGGDYTSSIKDYKQAVKLDKKAAVFHSNLGTAYFEVKDFESAEKQFVAALKLDPEVFNSSSASGIQAHVLSPADRGRFCYEMAKLAAQQGKDAEVLDWLAKSVETGFEVRYEMNQDRSLAAYRNDPRVAILFKNAKAMRAGLVAAAGPVPTLPAEAAKFN